MRVVLDASAAVEIALEKEQSKTFLEKIKIHQ